MTENIDDQVELSPWIHTDSKNPPTDGATFFAWDEQLERLVKSMQWFGDDIQDFGTVAEPWSGNFEYWMPADDSKLSSIGPPCSYLA